ncbi:MAG: CoA-binding protein [Elusimicrobia bacterium]|jgi:predicted CoA-binding protein|nr:CoA-binding protein [Elusimicrobiota bacterium]
MKTVAVIGASLDRTKFGNKSVRAHLKAGYRVFPVHPRETEIEGLPVYKSIRDVPEPLDRVTLYIPPGAGLQIIEDIAKKNPKELFLNPGTESPELIERAKALGLDPLRACSIVDLGYHAADI